MIMDMSTCIVGAFEVAKSMGFRRKQMPGRYHAAVVPVAE